MGYIRSEVEPCCRRVFDDLALEVVKLVVARRYILYATRTGGQLCIPSGHLLRGSEIAINDPYVSV